MDIKTALDISAQISRQVNNSIIEKISEEYATSNQYNSFVSDYDLIYKMVVLRLINTGVDKASSPAATPCSAPRPFNFN